MKKIPSLSFDEKEEGITLEEQVSEGFGSYDKETDYEIVTRVMDRVKLNDVDAKIMKFLAVYPLVPTSCIVDCVGESAYERIKVLFDHGYVSRLSATNQKTGFVRSAYFIAKAYRDVCRFGNRNFGDSLDQMSYTEMLEIASISKWAAYALHYQPKKDVRMISYKEKTKENPYLEAVVEKDVNSKWFMRGTPCRFHVITCPKDDRMLAFLSRLYYYDSLVKEEEEKMIGTKSFVVIICQSIASMEHLAVEIENMIYSKTRDALSNEHFLYSLETDGQIELGAFKFMHSISFPELTIRHEQVAFR